MLSDQTLQMRPIRKKIEGRGKNSAPTRVFAGFRLAHAVPHIAVKHLAGGTFQPAPLSPPPSAAARHWFRPSAAGDSGQICGQNRAAGASLTLDHR